MLKTERKAFNARALHLKAKGEEHPTHGEELQGLREELARLGSETDKRRREV